MSLSPTQSTIPKDWDCIFTYIPLNKIFSSIPNRTRCILSGKAGEVREKVYFFPEEEGGLEGWRHSNCQHTAVSGIPHLLPLYQETANCLPKTASSLSIPAGLGQGRPHTSNSAAPPPVRTWLSYYKNPGKSHHQKSIWPPLSWMWKINNQSYQASSGQHWKAKLQTQQQGKQNKKKHDWRKNQALPISGNDKQEKCIGENNGGSLLRYPKGL